MTRPTRPRYAIELQDIGGDTPVAIRLRHFLRRALRDWGLKCTRAVEITDEQTSDEKPVDGPPDFE